MAVQSHLAPQHCMLSILSCPEYWPELIGGILNKLNEPSVPNYEHSNCSDFNQVWLEQGQIGYMQRRID